MITITYHPDYPAVTIEGHAGSGEAGKDLVCCAVSSIAYTLAANLRKLEGEGLLCECVVDMVPGLADIRCTAAQRFRYQAHFLFDSLCLGFAELAEQYPEYVRYHYVKF